MIASFSGVLNSRAELNPPEIADCVGYSWGMLSSFNVILGLTPSRILYFFGAVRFPVTPVDFSDFFS